MRFAKKREGTDTICRLYCDASADSTKEVAAIAVVMEVETDNKVLECNKYAKEAQYFCNTSITEADAIIYGMQLASYQKKNNLFIYTDCEDVMNKLSSLSGKEPPEFRERIKVIKKLSFKFSTINWCLSHRSLVSAAHDTALTMLRQLRKNDI